MCPAARVLSTIEVAQIQEPKLGSLPLPQIGPCSLRQKHYEGERVYPYFTCEGQLCVMDMLCSLPHCFYVLQLTCTTDILLPSLMRRVRANN